MEPLTLLLFAGGAFLAAKALGARTTAKQQQQTSTQTRPAPNAIGVVLPTVTSSNDAAGMVAMAIGGALNKAAQSVSSIPLVGAAAAGVTIGATIGGKITGDWQGAVAGGLNIGAGNAANVGRIIGADIDRLFGGDGTTGTGIVAQVVGFLGGLAAATFGLSALVGFGPLGLLTLGVASLVSDLTRLAYGQAGLLRDMTKDANATFNASVSNAFQQLQAAGYSQQELTSADTQNRLQANAIALTIGYMKQKNKLQKQVWMKKPHGIGADDAYHEKFGADRGIFLTDSNFSVLASSLTSILGGGLYGVVISDAQKAACAKTGQFLANGIAWQQFLFSPWGSFITSFKQHLDFGRAQGVFDADLVLTSPDGDTVYMGSAMSVQTTKSSGKLSTYPAPQLAAQVQSVTSAIFPWLKG